MDSTIQQVVKEFGRIDSITNCVGSVLLKSAHTTSDKEARPHPTLAITITCPLIREKGGALLNAAADLGALRHQQC